MINKDTISQAVVGLAVSAGVVTATQVGYENAAAGVARSDGLAVSVVLIPLNDRGIGGDSQMSDWYIQWRIDCPKGAGTYAGRVVAKSIAVALQGERGVVGTNRFSVYRAKESPGGFIDNGSYRLFLDVYVNGIN